MESSPGGWRQQQITVELTSAKCSRDQSALQASGQRPQRITVEPMVGGDPARGGPLLGAGTERAA